MIGRMAAARPRLVAALRRCGRSCESSERDFCRLCEPSCEPSEFEFVLVCILHPYAGLVLEYAGMLGWRLEYYCIIIYYIIGFRSST